MVFMPFIGQGEYSVLCFGGFLSYKEGSYPAHLASKVCDVANTGIAFRIYICIKNFLILFSKTAFLIF